MRNLVKNRFDIEGNLKKYLPVLFELLAPKNISDRDWLNLNEKLDEYFEEKKKVQIETGKPLLVEANLYGVIASKINGDKSATKLYEFISKTLKDLSNKLSSEQKKQIRETIYKMLVELNKDYRNFFAELAILNALLNDGYSLLRVDKDKICGDKTADFTIEKNGEIILIEVVSIHIYEPLERLADFINGKIIDKLNNKTNNGSPHKPFKLVPVIWAFPTELFHYHQQYKAGMFKLPDIIHEPFAYSTVCTDEEKNIWEHRFWKISHLYSASNIEVIKD